MGGPQLGGGSGAVVAAPKIEGDPFWTRLFVIAEPKVQRALAPSRSPAGGPSRGNVADWGVHSLAGAGGGVLVLPEPKIGGDLAPSCSSVIGAAMGTAARAGWP